MTIVLVGLPLLVSWANGPTLAVVPAEAELNGPSSRQRVVVGLVNGATFLGSAAHLQSKSSNPKIADFENGLIVPKGNGETTIEFTADNKSALMKVRVRDFEKETQWTFRNHVQSVLTKQGCNSGACHGAIAGKNGFRLSLRGFDNEGDYDVLTRQVRGRRVDVQQPGRSLLLLKPTTRVSHGGGARLEEGSVEFNVIADWIAHGAPAPSKKDAQIARLEILPSTMQLGPDAEQQTIVRAWFSDGHSEDVTRWAKYTSTNEEAVHVDEHGLAKVVGRGEAAVTAWYLNQIAVARIAVPYDVQQPLQPIASANPRGFIDTRINEKLRMLRITPSPVCSDEEFIRRAFIDAIGMLPTAEEVQAFVAEKKPGKRDRLIDSLLERPEFVDYWSYRWSDLLLVNSERLQPAAMWSYYRWIRKHVAANTPWDEFTRELVTAQGSSLQNGAVNFFALHPEPTDLVETISTAFMGMPLNCCRCHNHPLEKWTNDDYYGFLNLVSRVRRKDGVGAGDVSVFVVGSGDIPQQRTGRVLPPRTLDGEPLAPADHSDRRITLAKWLTAPDNPYFARCIANRIWANFMGVALVETVDDLRMTNPASNEELLSDLARHLVDEKFNLKSLMRAIMQSEAYQRSSIATGNNASDGRFYSRYYPRRLMAEVLLDAISQVSGSATKFDKYPDGWRALQLPDSNVASQFLQKFGRPDRTITCDCERTSEPSMVQVLHLSNGEVLNKKLADANNRIGKAFAEKKPIDAMIDECYLSALARKPTREERDTIVKEFNSMKTPTDQRKFIEDVYWSVLSSKDFLFNR